MVWALLATKAGRWVGHWLVYLLLTAIVLWAGYVTIIRPHTKPNPTTSEKAETIYHETYNCRGLFVFGCGSRDKKDK
jgi:flagellar biosynthesis/type III secretory pathway M-ring protein FliF/YscJ